MSTILAALEAHPIQLPLIATLLIGLLRKYQRRSPEFYQRIVAARQVVDRPGSATR